MRRELVHGGWALRVFHAVSKPVLALGELRHAVSYYGSLRVVLGRAVRVLRNEEWLGLLRPARIMADMAKTPRGRGGLPEGREYESGG